MFVAIVTTESFSKAAAKLHVAQPSVSHQIRQLEEELGERLLFRSRNRKIYLTEAGKVFRKHAENILRQEEILRMEISALSNEPSGDIHIGVGGHQLTSTLAPALQGFHVRYPRTRIDIVNGTTPQIVERLKSNTLDIGVVTFPVTAKELRTEVLFSEEMVVVVRRRDPLAKKQAIAPVELERLQLVLYDQTTRTRLLLEEFFKREGISPQVVFELSSVEAMQMMVKAGAGATIIPASAVMVGSYRDSLHPLRIKGKPLTREVGVAMPHFLQSPRIVEAMLDLIKERFQEVRSTLHQSAG